MPLPLDCLIVGAGPAGLTAALYLARFRRRVLAADAGASRAQWIPRSRNVPGFAEGVGGEALLDALRRQLGAYDVQPISSHVDQLRLDGEVFAARIGEEAVTARTVILATGVVETIPPIEGAAEAIRAGVLRVCPICDGYEAQGRRVAVMGAGDHAAREALFLRTFAKDVVLLLTPDGEIAPDLAKDLEAVAVKTLKVGLDALSIRPGAVAARGPDGLEETFDAVYSAFGVTPQVKLARGLGVALDEQGRVKTGDDQQTSVAGVYAAGDVVRGLNQISVAVGEAAIAATAVHNRLAPNPC